ncbi:hypothetical protein ACQEVI_12415 [Promicromonospora sp. CA-289599]|uniref:hypothetical protein n=1 Tax=Promicromonospora sp. CA-289599 TaxID=3240014 RepID=UPI003D8E1792
MASDPTSGRPEGPGEPAGLDPAETLRMIREQQETTRDAVEPDGRMLFGVWGLAWLIGYLAMWSTARDTGSPERWAAWVFTGCIVGAMVFTIAHSISRTAGTRGVSARVGALYGWTWFLAFAVYGALLGAMGDAGAPPEALALVANGVAALIVGLMYMAGGMLFCENRMIAIGGWMLITAVVAAYAGMPNTYLVMAVAGGGGFLAMVVVEHVLRGRRRASPPTARTEGGDQGA